MQNSSALTPYHSQAESELSDKTKREELDAVINQARNILLKAQGLPAQIVSDISHGRKEFVEW